MISFKNLITLSWNFINICGEFWNMIKFSILELPEFTGWLNFKYILIMKLNLDYAFYNIEFIFFIF